MPVSKPTAHPQSDAEHSSVVRQSPIRRLLLGAALHSGAAPHQKIPKIIALPVFSSDALSSVAYATQASMIALAAAGAVAFNHTIAIAGVIVLLLVILTISYNQTIYAYPSGGGAYIVARDNLGVIWSEIAAAALLTDYILTVAVSVSSGIDALISAYAPLDHLPIRLALNVCATLFVMLMNLRGVKEAGAFFALPTYAFVFSILTLIGLGIWYCCQGIPLPHIQLLHDQINNPRILRHVDHLVRDHHTMVTVTADIQRVTIIVLLHAFASGCTALTGVEAISNGIPAFRPPESRNAAVTMRWMALILGVMFLGISYLAQHLAALHKLLPSDTGETVISQIAHAVVGAGPFYYVIQWTTFLILILAANTSFADFPRLSAIAARDRHLPRWFNVVGDRLVYQNGIIVLALLAIALQVVFKGNTDALIPLYAIGVFVAFTLSQTGMVFRWARLKTSGWQWRIGINGLGACMTAVVAVMFACVKFRDGAWIVLVLIPLSVVVLTRIDRHYDFVRRRLRLSSYRPPVHSRPNSTLVLVGGLDDSTKTAVEYARLISTDVGALHLRHDPAETAALIDAWQEYAPAIKLELADDKAGGWRAAIMDELYYRRTQDRTSITTVVLPGSLTIDHQRHAGKRLSWILKYLLLNEPAVVLADAGSLTLPVQAPSSGAGKTWFMDMATPSSLPADQGASETGIVATIAPRARTGPHGRSQFRSDRHTVLLLVPGLHRGIVEAADFARQLGRDVRALHIELEPNRTDELRQGWERWAGDIPLIIFESPYRQLREPLMQYVNVTRSQARTDVLTVVVPEFVATRWWDKALHNQSGLLLKFALQGQPNVVVVNTRYFLDR